jgi:hypothetical protein
MIRVITPLLPRLICFHGCAQRASPISLFSDYCNLKFLLLCAYILRHCLH